MLKCYILRLTCSSWLINSGCARVLARPLFPSWVLSRYFGQVGILELVVCSDWGRLITNSNPIFNIAFHTMSAFELNSLNLCLCKLFCPLFCNKHYLDSVPELSVSQYDAIICHYQLHLNVFCDLYIGSKLGNLTKYQQCIFVCSYMTEHMWKCPWVCMFLRSANVEYKIFRRVESRDIDD